MQLHCIALNCIVFHGIVVILSKQLLPDLKELFTELISDNWREVKAVCLKALEAKGSFSCSAFTEIDVTTSELVLANVCESHFKLQ